MSSREFSSRAHESAWGAVDAQEASIGSVYVSMELDEGLLPVRLEFSTEWSDRMAPGDAGRELFAGYEAGIQRRIERVVEARGGWARGQLGFAGATPRRKQLELLLDASTLEQYRETSRLIGSFGDYRADGPTIEYGEPVLTIEADRFSITSFTVVPQWVVRADLWTVENEILGCVRTIRELRPKFVVRGDYRRYTDSELEAWNQQHYQQLIEQRRVS